MSEPSINYQPKRDNPDELLILTIEDGTNTIILHADALYWATYSTVKPSRFSKN